MGLFSRLTGSKPEGSGDAAPSTSTAASDSKPRRGLRKFDTAAFTLHEHCGIFSREVQACLQRHKVDPDPVAQQERHWSGVEDCKKIWDEYRTCGRKFFDTVNQASGKCAAEDAALKNCKGDAACEAAEVRAGCRLAHTSLFRRLQPGLQSSHRASCIHSSRTCAFRRPRSWHCYDALRRASGTPCRARHYPTPPLRPPKRRRRL